MNLYELTGAYLQLLEMAEDDTLDPETLRDTMESIDGEFEDKADGYAKVIAQLTGDVESIEKQIKRLDEMKNRLDGNIAKMKKILESAMIATGKRKFKTALFSFYIQRNNPSLDLIDIESVPCDFRIPQPDKIDKTGALKYIKEHGPQQWGSLKESESLRIR